MSGYWGFSVPPVVVSASRGCYEDGLSYDDVRLLHYLTTVNIRGHRDRLREKRNAGIFTEFPMLKRLIDRLLENVD